MKSKLLLSVSILTFLFTLSGCSMQWAPNWQESGLDQPTARSAALKKEAQLLFEQAENRNSLLASIEAHEQALAANPGDYSTLTALSTQYILLGTAYTEERREKSKNFRLAMSYAELGMYTNPDFKKAVADGADPWEAADLLDKQQAEAMFFWVTALQYEFKEGMTLPEKIANIGWMKRCLVFLDRTEQVAPEFGGGGVEFAKVICYYVLPGFQGGSEEKGDEYMARAVARSDGWMLPRWARGKYYYVVKGVEGNSREDLKWVASQNIADFKDPTPWKIHFQQDAKALLP